MFGLFEIFVLVIEMFGLFVLVIFVLDFDASEILEFPIIRISHIFIMIF